MTLAVDTERVVRLAADTPAELAALLDPGELTSTGEGPCRLGLVAPSKKSLALARKVVTKGRPWRGRGDVWFTPTPLLGGTAFLFPGLEAEFTPAIDDVAAWLAAPVPQLSNASIGRHAASVLAVGRLLDRALRALRIEPDALAGHSVGEWSAMTAGGLIAEPDLDELLRRTNLDELPFPDVDFGVIGCPAAPVATEIAARPGLVMSHQNSTNQTVVCGPPSEVAALLDEFRARGVICQVLPFRSGFHTPLLRPHLAAFEAGVPSLPVRAAVRPVWSATTARPFPSDPDAVRSLAVRHLVEPVRFRDLVLGLYVSGMRMFVQVGAGQLGSLVGDTLRDVEHVAIAANSAHRSGVAQLRRVATAVWVEGGDPAFPDERPSPIVQLSAASDVPKLHDRGDGPGAAVARLEALDSPLGADLARLMAEVADAVTTVLSASASASAQPQPSAARPQTLRVSTRTMPYLLDHCFAPQRPGWPDETDLRPLVPAATIVHHLMAAPGRPAIGVDDVALHRWLVAAPAHDVPVRPRPLDTNRVHVSLGEYADGVVVLGDAHPPAPPAWAPEPDEQAPRISAAQLYSERWMFHGPRFQGVTRSLAIAERGVRAEITVPDAPGALLDAVGQVLGQWLVERQPDRWIAFPARIARIRFHAPPPSPGTRVECAVRIRSLAEETVEADVQVTRDGRPIVSISGWQDHRLASDPRIAGMHRCPELSTVSERQADGSWLAVERWPDLASREFYLHKYLNAPERAGYARCPPRERRAFLLRHIATKDAARSWLWERGAGPLFPAELTVTESGVTGRNGLAVPALYIAVEQHGESAAAFVTKEKQ